MQAMQSHTVRIDRASIIRLHQHDKEFRISVIGTELYRYILRFMIGAGHEDVVLLLVEAVDKSPTVAQRNGSSARARRVRRGQPMTPVHWAAAGGHARCVAAMMTSSTWRKMADTPTTDAFEVGHFVSPSGTTPLMLAAKAGSSDVVRELLTSHRDIVVDRQDSEGDQCSAISEVCCEICCGFSNIGERTKCDYSHVRPLRVRTLLPTNNLLKTVCHS